jgi:hypothetical protein
MARVVYLAVFLGLAVFYYYLLGAGPSASEIMDLPWWRPRGWALRWEVLAPLVTLAQEPGAGRLIPVALFTLPPIAGVGLGMTLFRNPLARVLLLALGTTLAAFAFYGFLAPGIWAFFSWRWPAVTLAVALVLSSLILAPSLLRWARGLSPIGRATALCVVVLAVYLSSVEITGTNWALPANISPWPVVTMFGFLLFGYFAVAIHTAVGLGALLRSRVRGPAAISAGILASALLSGAATWLILSTPTVRTMVSIGLLGAIAAFIVLFRETDPADAASRGWNQLGAAALVVSLILLSDQAASRDLAGARNHVAPIVLDALQAYWETNHSYPDSLQNLVPDYLEEIPRPRVGLIQHEGERFLYTNLGDSFLLEFAGAKWVQCAYSPPYQGLELDFRDPNGADPNAFAPTMPDVAAGTEDPETALEGSWSCDPALPRLW